jgi:hypothetical protein
MLTSECGWKGGDRNTRQTKTRQGRHGYELAQRQNALTSAGLLMEGQCTFPNQLMAKSQVPVGCGLQVHYQPAKYGWPVNRRELDFWLP